MSAMNFGFPDAKQISDVLFSSVYATYMRRVEYQAELVKRAIDTEIRIWQQDIDLGTSAPEKISIVFLEALYPEVAQSLRELGVLLEDYDDGVLITYKFSKEDFAVH